MQPDLGATGAETAAPETTAPASDALPVEPTSDSDGAVENESIEQATGEQPTPESEDSAEDDGDDEGTETAGEQTEEQKKLSRRERQRQREQERIDKAIAEALAESKRSEAEAAERAKREADAQKAREAAAKEFAEYIGEEGEADRLTSEIADLNRKIRSEVAEPQGIDLDALEAEIRTKEGRLSEITRAQGFQAKIAQNVWNGIEAHVMSPLSWPEFSDPATKQRYLMAEGGIAGALSVLKDVLVSAAEARKDAEIKAVKETHASEVATLREEMRGWRVRAGAEEVPDTTSGGPAVNGTGTYTRERLRQMMATPEGIAEYRRNRAEIERQELAGLIR